jgi:PAT family acetyl-CoA transporter-like MFS transporter 1
MTLLNTAANLGGTWPASFVMGLLGLLTTSHVESTSNFASSMIHDPYTSLQIVFSILGVAWIFILGPKLRTLSRLPDDAWRTHLLDGTETGSAANDITAMESGDAMDLSRWTAAKNEGKVE